MNATLVTVSLVATVFLSAPAAPDAGADAKRLQAILTGPSPTKLETLAAEILARNFEKRFGVKLPVNPAGSKVTGDVQHVVLVGKTAATVGGMIAPEDLEKVKHDGFVVKVEGGRIALAGPRDRGAVYGAYALLERLGCRHYAAGCETVAAPGATVLPACRFSDRPAIEFRSGVSWPLYESVGDIGDPRQAADPELFKDSSLWIDHSSGYLVPKGLYYDAHPEYFAISADGKRMPKTTRDSYVHLCLTHPEVLRISTERALVWMRVQPERRFFCITAGDGVGWCQCDKCKAQDVVPGNYSDRLLAWVNHIARAVAREFPDNVLLTFAYAGTDTPPLRQRPEANVLVLYCPYWGVALSSVHTLTHPSNAEALTMLEGWLKVAPKNVGIYDYNIGYTPSWDAMARKVQWYAGKGIRGIWHCGHPTCFRDLFGYCVARLEWNPSLELPRLKEEFVRAYYAPAAPHVLQYLKLVEDRLEQGYTRGCHEFHMPAGYYERQVVEDSLALFAKMAAAAGEDKGLLARIDNERRLFLADYQASVTLRTEPLRPADREFALRLLKEGLGDLLRQHGTSLEKLKDEKLPRAQVARLEKDRDSARQAIRAALTHTAALALKPGEDPIQVAEALVKDPETVIKQHPQPSLRTAPEKIPGGIRLPATAFQGGFGPREYGWQCEPRTCMTAYAAKGPRPSRMWATFELDSEPDGALLNLEGQDADKDLPPKAKLRIAVNGKTIFEGPCRFAKRGWSWDSLEITKGVLVRGTNRIDLINPTSSARLDHYWFMISEAVLRLGPSGAASRP